MAARGGELSVETIIARYGLAAVLLGAGVEGETAVVTGGVLAHRGLLPLWGVMIAAVAGSFAADQLFFAGGRRSRDIALVRRIRDRPAFAKALGLLERHPKTFIFTYRFIYGIRTVSPIAIGASGVPTRTFVTVNLIAAIVWGTGFSAIGYAFGNVIEQAVGRIGTHRLLLAAALVLALAGIGVAVRRLRRTR